MVMANISLATLTALYKIGPFSNYEQPRPLYSCTFSKPMISMQHDDDIQGMLPNGILFLFQAN